MSVKTEVDKWIADKCNERLIANYPLDENSWVIDLGGYFGAATQKVVSKYNCNVLVIEPVEDFYNIIIEKFKDNSKVIVENNGQRETYLDNFVHNGKKVPVLYTTNNTFGFKQITTSGKVVDEFKLTKK
jgi:16S rRNA A1518/A1519 N6-dimethyltransferase RsmA/KsgA/DIM1 with predicted DNA glycosylase/AP lyase activity